MLFIITYKLKQLVFKKGNSDNDWEYSSQPDETIPLKGRVKKIPNNINYNELFVNKEKLRKKNKQKEIKAPEVINNNFNDFLDKVKEKEDVLNILENGPQIIPPNTKQEIGHPFEMNNHYTNNDILLSSDFKGDLLIFDKKELNSDDLCPIKNADTIVTVKSNLYSIPEMPNEETENTLCSRLKNKDLFSRTPLTCLVANNILK
jgi:hypothetical protein